MKKIIISIVSALAFLLNATYASAAQITIAVSPPENQKIVDLGKLLSGVVGIILVIAALAAFIYLILGGLQWITSGGDKGKVESAQHRIQAAIIGLIIVFGVWAIFMVLEQVIGVSILRGISIPTLY